MQKDIVLFKNSPERLLLVLDSQEPFENLLAVIKDKVYNNKTFFTGYDLHLRYKGRSLTSEEERSVSDIFTEAGSNVADISEEQIRLKNINRAIPKNEPVPERKKSKNVTTVNDFYKGTVRFFNGNIRSGQAIECDGTVVVMGDVNPGADIKATGNIIVFGTIRGNVSAGTEGSNQSIIIGMGIYPASLSIAQVITRPPEEEIIKLSKGLLRSLKKPKEKDKSNNAARSGNKELEVAYLQDGVIHIEPYNIFIKTLQ